MASHQLPADALCLHPPLRLSVHPSVLRAMFQSLFSSFDLMSAAVLLSILCAGVSELYLKTERQGSLWLEGPLASATTQLRLPQRVCEWWVWPVAACEHRNVSFVSFSQIPETYSSLAFFPAIYKCENCSPLSGHQNQWCLWASACPATSRRQRPHFRQREGSGRPFHVTARCGVPEPEPTPEMAQEAVSELALLSESGGHL